MQTDVAPTWVDRSPRLTRWDSPGPGSAWWSGRWPGRWGGATGKSRSTRSAAPVPSSGGVCPSFGCWPRPRGARRRPAGVRGGAGAAGGARVCCRRSGELMSCVRWIAALWSVASVATAMWALAWGAGPADVTDPHPRCHQHLCLVGRPRYVPSSLVGSPLDRRGSGIHLVGDRGCRMGAHWR